MWQIRSCRFLPVWAGHVEGLGANLPNLVYDSLKPNYVAVFVKIWKSKLFYLNCK